MNKKIMTALVVVALAGVLATTTGCTWVKLQDRPETRTTTETKTVDLGGATSLTTNIRFGVGSLNISAADTTVTAMVADFTYAPAGWKPEVEYAVEGSAGVLTVSQPDRVRIKPFSNVRNTWNLRLGKGIPTDLKLQLGVGDSDVDLRGIDVSRLEIQSGVGGSTIDLSGPRTSSVTGRIQAGVGDMTVRLPRGIGVRVSGRHDGVGGYSAEGFVSNGDSWENEAYLRATGPKIEIELQRGVGDVTLVLVD